MATSRFEMRSLSETHGDAAGDGEADEAPQGRQADQAGAGRAGETDMRQRVAGEGLSAHHQEEADQPRHHGDDAGGGEGVGHEIVSEHVSYPPPATSFPLPRARFARGGEGSGVGGQRRDQDEVFQARRQRSPHPGSQSRAIAIRPSPPLRGGGWQNALRHFINAHDDAHARARAHACARRVRRRGRAT